MSLAPWQEHLRGALVAQGPSPGLVTMETHVKPTATWGCAGSFSPWPRSDRRVAQRTWPLQAEVCKAAERAPSWPLLAIRVFFVTQRVFLGNYLFHLTFQIYLLRIKQSGLL